MGWILVFLLSFPLVSRADAFEVTSPTFENNGKIPSTYTCDGQDINPPLDFNDIPPGAKSLALTVTDPDASNGTWTHWIIYNIPSNTRQIMENTSPGAEGINDFGHAAYGGPCPPAGKMHHYIFHAYALDNMLDVNKTPNLADIQKALRPHVLAESQLTGTYQK